MAWTTVERKSFGPVEVAYDVRVAPMKSRNTKKGTGVSITFRKGFLESRGWAIGDRVVVMVDQAKRRIGLSRENTQNAYKITTTNTQGKHVAGQIACAVPFRFATECIESPQLFRNGEVEIQENGNLLILNLAD